MKVRALIRIVHRSVRTGLVSLAIAAAVLGYPGAENRQPTAAASPPTVMSVASPNPVALLAASTTATSLPRPGPWGFAAAFAASQSPFVSLLGAASLSPLFAQASFESAVVRFLQFISTVLVLLGIGVVVYGGWMVSQGKTGEGVNSMIGGFLMVAAVVVVRLFGQYVGTTF